MLVMLFFSDCTILKQQEIISVSDISTQNNYESCNNVVFKANILVQYCFKQQSLVNSAITKNFKFVQAVNLNSQHNVFQSVQRIQNIIISSSIVHNQSAETSFTTFGLSSIPHISQVSIDVDLQSRYNVVAFLVRSQNKLNISYSTFNFSCVYSDNVSSILAIEDSLSLLHVDMYLYYIGQYVSGLVMSSQLQAQILLNQSNMYGSLHGSELTAQISGLYTTTQIKVIGKICLNLVDNNCPFCFLQQSSCCHEDAQIVPYSNYYTCECIDPLKKLFDPLNPRTSSCICTQNNFLLNSQCVQCPTDSFSSINSTVCTCSQQFQKHNVETNECECVPKYSTKIYGICSCLFENSDINEDSCFCLNGFGLVSGTQITCACEANKYINNSVCTACPSDAHSSVNDYQCTCDYEYQRHNTGANRCECYPIYSSKIAFGGCTCPDGSIISNTSCNCYNGQIMLSSMVCGCGLKYYVNNSQCVACPNDAYSSAVNSPTCTCNQANQIHNKLSNECQCTPLYSSKLATGVCTCFDGAIIQGNTCFCINNFLLNSNKPYSCYCSSTMRSGDKQDQCVRSGTD
ncbi:Conserved_hypothetical protein [Hexamita inflata]|uniref:Uncharacterized protein n=1 Tax=Hexamita inflata TaxID=28002 RepID=A0AA86Q4U1_9EUKA|nr:Conserved hypothetical protein [Hexamita inflata]